MSPLSEPIYGFRPFTPSRTLEVREAREKAWAALALAEQPKVRKARAPKVPTPLPPCVPADQQALVLETLKKLGLA